MRSVPVQPFSPASAPVVFGAYEPKTGMGGSVGDLLRHPVLNHSPEVRGGVMEQECAELLREFFEPKRGRRGNDPTS